MSWFAVGAAAIGAAGSITAAAMANQGGGGGGINSKAIKNALKDGMEQLNAAIGQARANVGAAVRGMDKKIETAVGELRNASDGETKQFWNNLGLFNDQLINSATALTETYNGDVLKALESLEGTVNTLNESYSEDMESEIARYGSVENAINARLAERADVAETEFLDRVGQAQREYEEKSLGEADAAKAEAMSLGDTFMQRSQDAMDRFDRVVTQSPEFLQEASRAADSLSKSALQTRMDLLSTADPRALELSAIADENAAAMMSGRISADVQANLSRSSAMRALQGGFGASSEMGRGLAARDLGLTSLDLQQRGAALNDAQRRLNYETRVAGTQVNPFQVSEQMQRGEQALMNTAIGTAESDRNQRLTAAGEASAQRLQTFDRLFGSRLGTADTLRGQDMTLAAQLSSQERDANVRTSAMRIGATQDIYNNMSGLADTVFSTRTGLAGQNFQTGLSVVGDIYKNNVGAAGTVYNTRTGLESNIFGGRTDAAVAGMQAQAAIEAAALQAKAAMHGGNTATAANIPLARAAASQGRAQQSAQLWGSAFNTVSSLAGSYLGNQNWGQGGRSFGMSSSQMQSSTIPGTTGTYQSWAGGYVPRATAA